MAMIPTAHHINATEGVDMIKSTDKITTGLFSEGVTKLIASGIHSQSLSDSNEVYYFGIAKDNTTGSVQLHVAYGNSNGKGGNSHGDDIKSPTEAVYKSWANTLLAENEITGGFIISSAGSAPAVATGKDTEIYVLVAQRSLYKDRWNKKNWTIVLSGSTSANVGAPALHLTDDSNTTKPTPTPAGPRYNIVSGSQGAVAKAASTTTYGWFYPDQGVLVFSGAELSASFPASASDAGNVARYRSTSVGNGFAGFGFDNSSEDDNYKNALRFVNCLKPAGAYVQARSEEDQTNTAYFCRVHAGESNFSNNPTFTSGSLNEIRQETMKGNPSVYITGVQLYNSVGDMVAVGNLSTPLKKNFSSEATIKVKLGY